MKIILIFSVLLLFANTEDKELVKIAGSLKGIMQQNDISSKIDLNKLNKRDNLYALGAAENLKGEIQIFNGKPYNSQVESGKLLIENTYDKEASLLVYANVDEWIEKSIDKEISDLKSVQKIIESFAEQNKIDLSEPIPFLLKGKAENLSWHVIDWNPGDSLHTHKRHKSSGLSGELKNEIVEIIGFYSDKHHGIITHHSTNIHLHFKNKSGNAAGHVDDLKTKKEIKIYFPKQTIRR